MLQPFLLLTVMGCSKVAPAMSSSNGRTPHPENSLRLLMFGLMVWEATQKGVFLLVRLHGRHTSGLTHCVSQGSKN